jgi:tetratricopeptide (TPR) repeat protein
MKKSRFIIVLAGFLLVVSCAAPDFEKDQKKAQELIGIGDFKKAAKIYNDLIKASASDREKAVVYFELGNLYAYQMMDIAGGLAAYQKCIESSPYSEAARLAHERRAEIFETQGIASKMASEYSDLLKYFPENENVPRYQLRLGEAYIAAKEYQQAREELRGFVEQAGVPADLRHKALFDIGETYFLESKPGKAVRFYYAFIQEDPASPFVPEAKLRIATCLEEMGYLGMAQKFAQDAAKSYPNKEVTEKRLNGIKTRTKTAATKRKEEEKKAKKKE